MKKTSLILIFILFLGVLSYLIYFFPIQKYLAEKKFEEYIVSQGTSINNIDSKEIFKDYKSGGYFIRVIFKDNPEFTYEYTYLPNGEMICIIYDEDNVSVGITNKKVKYPSLD